MTAREWKPGDVAMRRSLRGEERVTVAVEHGSICGDHDTDLHWHHANGGWDPLVPRMVTYHPLAVIDPSAIPHLSDFDKDAARALSKIADDVAEVGGDDLDATELILRWLADQMPKPPKPEEPTGLGAVVEDAEGVQWVRIENRPNISGHIWASSFHVKRPDRVDYARYDEIAAVSVLAEGVTR